MMTSEPCTTPSNPRMSLPAGPPHYTWAHYLLMSVSACLGLAYLLAMATLLWREKRKVVIEREEKFKVSQFTEI